MVVVAMVSRPCTLKSGRDVVALDTCDEYISVLRERAARLNGAGVGKLTRSVVARLPDSSVIDDASVAGILCSEMIHFLKPGELRQLFKDFFRWVAPGGKVVVTAASWPGLLRYYVETQGFKLPEGRSVKDVLEMPRKLSPSELVDAAPGMVFVPDDSPWKKVLGDLTYNMSTEELRTLAESSGFVVEEVTYCHSGKYAIEGSEANTLLRLHSRSSWRALPVTVRLLARYLAAESAADCRIKLTVDPNLLFRAKYGQKS